MSTVEEIESAINKLPSSEITRLASWILKRDNAEWDRQMNEDAAAGQLDFLVEEAKAARDRGALRDWPGSAS